MKIQHFIQIGVLLSANLTFAFPIDNLRNSGNGMETPTCQRNSQQNNFRALIEEASYMGDDDRKVLSKNMQTVGFSAAEQEQAMRCSGDIFCPGGKDGTGSTQSAGAICPPGSRSSGGHCSADRLGTVAHMFVNETTNRFIPKLDKCEFTNYRGHKSKLYIQDLNSIDPKLDNQNPRKNMRADKMVIRLKSPIPGCDPYDLDEEPISPSPGSKVIALTFKHVDQPNSIADGTEPLAFNCEIRKTFAPKAGTAGVFYSDCDINGGGSGGFALVRNADGRLAVTGLFSGSGSVNQNGQSYNEATKNFTAATSTNGDFLQMALNPGQRPEPQLTESKIPSQRPTSN